MSPCLGCSCPAPGGDHSVLTRPPARHQLRAPPPLPATATPTSQLPRPQPGRRRRGDEAGRIASGHQPAESGAWSWVMSVVELGCSPPVETWEVREKILYDWTWIHLRSDCSFCLSQFAIEEIKPEPTSIIFIEHSYIYWIIEKGNFDLVEKRRCRYLETWINIRNENVSEKKTYNH